MKKKNLFYIILAALTIFIFSCQKTKGNCFRSKNQYDYDLKRYQELTVQYGNYPSQDNYTYMTQAYNKVLEDKKKIDKTCR